MKKEEHELLETQSLPLRNYLMKHVMPTLTEALIDCCKARPDDAIDYLVSTKTSMLPHSRILNIVDMTAFS